ncbi:PA14 domain-containing protein [Streptomyces sp. NPDC092369]|uniref:fibronectin type III domain-containing protein n=1 Tax=Streptomyces sp. NPDC092369 TaxID=3366015 RepID=UPI00381CA3BF
MNPARRTTAATAAAVALTTATTLLTVSAAPASAATTCTSPLYKRQLFANTTFKGTPKKTACDSAIDETWTGAPSTGLPKDNFGVRWSVTRDFGSGGPFALTATATDGIRVYLDDSRKINLWSDTTGSRTKTVNVTIPKGTHTLRIDYVNWKGAAKVKVGYTPRTSATVDKVKPLVPTSAEVEYLDEEFVSSGKVTWSANKEMDLAGYRLYRRVKGSGTWTKVATTTARSHTDAPPATGESYYYEVRAYDKAGNESAGTADLGPISTWDTTSPAKPVLAAEGVEASNNLSWTGPSDAAKYRILRKPSTETSYTQIDETTAATLTYADTEASYGKAYDYVVTAVDRAGNTARSAAVRSTRSILPPQNVTATVPSYGVVFTWTEAPGGDSTDYDVYRSTTSPVETTYDNLVNCRDREIRTDAAGARIRSCVDEEGDQGTTYHYVMTRQNTAGRWSTGSAEMTVTRPGDEIPPPPVTHLTAEPLEYGVKLDWDDSPAADLDRYQIYEYAPHSGLEYLDTVSGSTSEYVAGPSVADGETRKYAVVPVDVYGNSADQRGNDWDSPVSTVTVTEQDLRPTTVPEDTAPCFVAAYTTLGDAGGMYVECADSVATEAAGINVYRWDRTSGTYVRLTDVPLAPTATSYVDRTLPPGTTVYYLLSVVARDGSETFSNVDSAVSLPSGE